MVLLELSQAARHGNIFRVRWTEKGMCTRPGWMAVLRLGGYVLCPSWFCEQGNISIVYLLRLGSGHRDGTRDPGNPSEKSPPKTSVFFSAVLDLSCAERKKRVKGLDRYKVHISAAWRSCLEG